MDNDRGVYLRIKPELITRMKAIACIESKFLYELMEEIISKYLEDRDSKEV